MLDESPRECPSPQKLETLTQGTAPLEEASTLRAHAKNCVRCAQLLTKASMEPQARGEVSEFTGGLGVGFVPIGTPLLKAGSSVGRYTVLEMLGEGGMGVVYAAYDAELHRKVALKLLHGATVGDESSTLGKARLLREAQALAQLSHPNVVGVHEVGTFEDNVFMAMEFVEGKTLRAWMKERPKWQEVLPVFLEAGLGLQEAHQKGLIHRDFKPDNVLLGVDGRVRVLDFGLARGASEVDVVHGSGASPAAPPASLAHPPSGEFKREAALTGSLSTPLTQAGRVMGTLSYMAPELLRGGPADVRTDVFAFCVSLYETLYVARPFTSDGNATLPEPPRDVLIPTWLRRAVFKGLQPQADARYRDFDEVLKALRSDPAPRRRQQLLAAATCLAMAAGIAGAYHLASRRSQLCHHEADRLRGVWDGAVAQRLEAAFVATGAPSPQDTWGRTQQILEDYAQQIVGMRTEACVDTRVKGSQPDTVMALRMACLDRRLSELRAFTEVLAQPSAAMVTDAMKTAAKLTPLDICANLTALKAPVPLPDSPAERRQVEAAHDLLARAKLLGDTGQYVPGVALADQALKTAETLHYRPLEAEAGWTKARIQKRFDSKAAGETALQAYLAAVAGSHPEVGANAASELLYSLGERGDLAGVMLWERVARVELEALGGDRATEMNLENSLGVGFRSGDPHKAEMHLRRLLTLSKQGHSLNDVVEGIRARNNLANALEIQHHLDEALTLQREALVIIDKNLGPRHPLAMTLLVNLGGSITDKAGPVDESVQDLERALALGTAGPVLAAYGQLGLGRDHALRGQLRLGITEMTRAVAELEKSLGAEGQQSANFQLQVSYPEFDSGHLDEARKWAQKALFIAEHSSSNSESLPSALMALAKVAQASGQRAEALPLLERARDLQLKANGPNSSETADVEIAFAEWHLDGHQAALALELIEKALAIQKKLYGPDYGFLGWTYLRQGEAELQLRHFPKAIAALEEASRRLIAGQFDPAAVAEAHFALARALWESGQDKVRAVHLAAQARLDFTHSETAAAKDRAALKTWLSQHP